MLNHRYSIEYIARVRNPAVREYLSSIGLPVEHVLFSASEATGGGIKKIEGRNLLKLGSGGMATMRTVLIVKPERCSTSAAMIRLYFLLIHHRRNCLNA
ncbi:hypothetical protein [Streptosporangium canum]|uniref:hypothetical protein n=1 Tax=Streptosporangium canum TaxID=324952 RepID=UPI0037896141